jgi:hypothetical protein
MKETKRINIDLPLTTHEKMKERKKQNNKPVKKQAEDLIVLEYGK